MSQFKEHIFSFEGRAEEMRTTKKMFALTRVSSGRRTQREGTKRKTNLIPVEHL